MIRWISSENGKHQLDFCSHYGILHLQSVCHVAIYTHLEKLVYNRARVVLGGDVDEKLRFPTGFKEKV